MVKSFRILIPAIFLIYVAGCSTPTDSTADSAIIDSLSIQYNYLLDSVDNSWNVMIEDDDEKIMFMKRLLKEIEYTQNYDRQVQDRMNVMVDSLKLIRYDRSTVAESNRIDQYDYKTQDVVVDVINYASKHPQFEQYPLMQELIQDIRQKDSDVLMLRVDYDHSARAYNNFIKENKRYMNEVDSAFAEKLPLFAIE